MPELKRYTLECREDWFLLLKTANEIIHEVMTAGEKQRIADGLPTDQWLTGDVNRYMHHAFMHLVSCKTYEGTHNNPFVLANNTSLEEYKHALIDLLIVAAAEQKKDGIVIESIDEE